MICPDRMPLFDRWSNLEYVIHDMKTTSEEIWDSEPDEGETVEDRMHQHAHMLGHYAHVFQTLMHHGTRGFYNAGCHCNWCGEANRQYYQRRSGKSRLKFVQSILEDAL